MSKKPEVARIKSELEMLRPLYRLYADSEGRKLGNTGWAVRRAIKLLDKYLNREETLMDAERRAQFIVKAVTDYGDHKTVFLVATHPDGMTLPDGTEDLPDDVFDAWYEGMEPDMEFTETASDAQVRFGGWPAKGVPVRFPGEVPWSIGDVLELTVRCVGHEDELVASLNLAIAALPPQEKSA